MYKPYAIKYEYRDVFEFRDALERLENLLLQLDSTDTYYLLNKVDGEIRYTQYKQRLGRDEDFKELDVQKTPEESLVEWQVLEDEVCHYYQDAKDNWLESVYYIGHDITTKWRRLILVYNENESSELRFDNYRRDMYRIMIAFDDPSDAVAFKLMANE
jgi:hypothetical protein